MRILWIGGNHSRHLYYINILSKDFPVSGGIMEVREAMIPQPPDRVSDLDRDNFIRHFKNRDLAEEKYFGSQPKPDFPLLEVRKDTLNEQESVEFVKQVNPDLVLIFGSGLVKEPLFSVLPEDKINLHLGLSPRYRGAATLFWPFYFMEPTYAGTTFHYIVSEPDAGKIIHQVVPPLDPEDGIHDVACKAVIQSTKDAIKLLEIYQFKGAWKQHKQRSTGKNFLSRDFKPEHLRVIYNVFDDDMVRRYLEGKLISKQPQLFRQY